MQLTKPIKKINFYQCSIYLYTVISNAPILAELQQTQSSANNWSNFTWNRRISPKSPKIQPVLGEKFGFGKTFTKTGKTKKQSKYWRYNLVELGLSLSGFLDKFTSFPKLVCHTNVLNPLLHKGKFQALSRNQTQPL
jgi:hypothetical protein